MPHEKSLTWAGLSLDRPRVMGVLNVTPDSFSDGGLRHDADVAIATALAMARDGADIIDVGGESTRPGAAPVPPDVEIKRILPVIAGLAAAGVRVSVDTRHAVTMRAALAAGACIVNDVSGLTYDSRAAEVVAGARCCVVLMHMRGTPATMSGLATYGSVVDDVTRELTTVIAAARRAGVAAECISVDPGIGFAKRPAHSLDVLKGLPTIAALGYPLLVGVSRKGFIGTISGEPNPAQRLGGSLAAALFAISRGASILRVHDVRETVQAVRVWQTLFESGTVPLSQYRAGGLDVTAPTMDRA